MLPGVFAIYKEEGMTSHDVVDAVRRLTGEQRVGHAGTLDPCAKGVLVIGVSRAATKTLSLVVGTEKEYVTRVRLGWRSTTEDREGKIEQTFWPTVGAGPRACPLPEQPQRVAPTGPVPTEQQVRQALDRFLGRIDQRPPVFSAIKIRGRAAYKRARAGKKVELAARPVEVREIELLGYAWPCVEVRLVTGSGFYVRAFARDLGEALGTGAYMDQLERIRVGSFTKEQAVHLADLAAAGPDDLDDQAAGPATPTPAPDPRDPPPTPADATGPAEDTAAARKTRTTPRPDSPAA
jgi:tRNA pseudouridine55 synthase